MSENDPFVRVAASYVKRTCPDWKAGFELAAKDNEMAAKLDLVLWELLTLPGFLFVSPDVFMYAAQHRNTFPTKVREALVRESSGTTPA